MGIVDQLRVTNNIVFDANYLSAGIADRGPYAAAATVTATASWLRTRQGYGLTFSTNAMISYADNANNRLAGSAATFVFFGRFERHPYGQRLISKRDVGGTSYDIFTHGSTVNTLCFYDGTNVRNTTGVGIAGRRCVIFTMTNGGTPACYLDGVFAANAAGSITIPNYSAPLLIGNWYGGAWGWQPPLHRVLICNIALTAKAIAQLYQELADQRFPLRAYSFGLRVSPPQDPPGVTALLKTDFTTKLGDGRLADLSGNGWHGTIKPGFYAGPGMCGNSLMANSATRSYVDFGDVAPINGASKLTVVMVGNNGDLTNSEAWLSKGSSADNRIDIESYNVNKRYYGMVGSASASSGSCLAAAGTPICQTWVYDGSQLAASRMTFYPDGNASTPLSIGGTFPVTLPNNAGVPLIAGSISWVSYPPPSKYQLLIVYPAALTADQVGYVYRQIAKRQTFRLDMQRVPVTLANISTVCEIPSTPLRVASGTWKLSEDSSFKHWLESVATNDSSVYCPSTQAFGTFVFDVYHTAASEYVWFISNTTSTADTARNAYGVYLNGTALSLTQYKPSAATTVLCSASNAIATGTKYSVAVTRRGDGQFVLYIKGGAYGTWTLLAVDSGSNPVAQTSYTTSSYCLFSTTTAASGGKFGSMRFFQGELPIEDLPND